MLILNHALEVVNPICECDDCEAGRHAEDIGMVEPTIDPLAVQLPWRAAEREDALAEIEAVINREWNEIEVEYSAEDERWAIETMPEMFRDGCCEWELSPEEEALEALTEPAWDRFNRWADELAAERELEDRLGCW